ncbi:hypothetical protein MLD38_005973 [Melastoma candidum]|uniref:Uncharacterized protein n=1 Tax=Melastoma candidum TaxID=119954 RepID=A0ACB9RKU1_9MYRT|nr:hypothetical protein MLD38_005973 [Melastoma candidum]
MGSHSFLRSTKLLGLSSSSALVFSNPRKFLPLLRPFASVGITRKDFRKKRRKEKEGKRTSVEEDGRISPSSDAALKRRTRSSRELDDEILRKYEGVCSHIPVMLGEVLDVFAPSRRLESFLDCTIGAAGHSSAVIQAHPELRLYVGMDVDPMAHQMAKDHVGSVLASCSGRSDVKAHIVLKNFRHVKSLAGEVGLEAMEYSFGGILMDLGMSSMQVNDAERGFSILNDGPLDMRMDPQASLKAKDILNSWPENEIGRILREYGEESNWYSLQNKIVKSRLHGGLHSTGELVNLIQSSTPRAKGGRQGWIKTASRVFQALRIAVNDELNTLGTSLRDCFECLMPGGRLAVISFHSLEDRIVKQTFLNIVRGDEADEDRETTEEIARRDASDADTWDYNEEWIKQVIRGQKGVILTKRPITPSEKEEKLNRRSRSAKLRVIQKV